MARPRFHALATLPFAWAICGRWGRGVAISFGAASILVDLDHLVDYLWMRWRGDRRHFLAPLHAWELVIAGATLSVLLRRRRYRLDRPGLRRGTETVIERTSRTAGAGPARSSLGALFAAVFAAVFDDARAEALVAGLAGGLTLHLVQDVLTNRPRHAGVYALGYRLRHGFDRHRVGWEAHTAFHAWTGKPWYTWI